ncbi:MAG: hypothetical protein JWO05_2814 [Gemmatimonadetes bacterium]|nr:hypothetical protein [Gemmatimonadota bacterium]
MAIESVTLLCVGAGPFVGYAIALRRPGRPRWHIVLCSAIGAGLPIALFGAAWATQGIEFSDLAPFALIAAIYGAMVGIAGLLARAFGRWLSNREG